MGDTEIEIGDIVYLLLYIQTQSVSASLLMVL